MIAKAAVATAAVLFFAGAAFLLTPVGVERSQSLAKTRFETYCVENRYDCNEFEGPRFVGVNDNQERVYLYEWFGENGRVITFEVRVPMSELGRVGLGTVNDPFEIRQLLIGE